MVAERFEIYHHYFKHPEMFRGVVNVVFNEKGEVIGKNDWPGSTYTEAECKKYIKALDECYGMDIFAYRPVKKEDDSDKIVRGLKDIKEGRIKEWKKDGIKE